MIKIDGLFLYRIDDIIDEKYLIPISSPNNKTKHYNSVVTSPESCECNEFKDLITEVQKKIENHLYEITHRITNLETAIDTLAETQNEFENRIVDMEVIANSMVDEMADIILCIQEDNERDPQKLKDILINEIGGKSIEITLRRVKSVIESRDPKSKYIPLVEQVIKLIELDDDTDKTDQEE